MRVTVLEAGLAVGGLARTVEYNGYLFDIGGHRFFTKMREVEALWEEILGDDFISVGALKIAEVRVVDAKVVRVPKAYPSTIRRSTKLQRWRAARRRPANKRMEPPRSGAKKRAAHSSR